MGQDNKYDFQAGTTLLVDKPLEWTSFDVVNKIRFALRKSLEVKKIKVGHAGTLDPLATGLLIICTGKSTKKIDSYQAQYKVYEGTFRLGATTPSFDAETETDQTFSLENLSPALINATVEKFVGDIEQTPPIYSAIKVDGQPLYKKARQGKAAEVKIKKRNVHIYSFEVDTSNFPDIDFRVKCSKGTYIRSLAHEFGQALNNGAYLTRLVRTHIGEHALANAWNLPELISHIQENYTAADNSKASQ
jgi:tRNA pseudouridine55 synthase